MEGVPSVNRVREEVRRELWRASSFWGLAGALALCLAVAAFAIAETALPVFTAAVYLVFPMLMAPLAAHRTARDRESGLSAAHSTTPLKPTETLLGKIVALSLLLAIALAATLPLLYAMTAHAAPGAFTQLIPLAAWGLIIGTVSLLAGLIVGYAKEVGSAGALTVAFTIVSTWFLLPLQRARFYGWADTPAELRFMNALLHASPFTWGLDALATDAAYLTPEHAWAMLGLTVLLGPIVLVLVAVSLCWQHMGGWNHRSFSASLATGLVAIGLVTAGGLLGSWDYARLDGAAEHPEEAVEGTIGDVHIGLRFESPDVWSNSPGTLKMTLLGEPNATVTLHAVEFTGDTAAIGHDWDLPRRIQLDEVWPTDEDSSPPGQAGWAELEIPTRLTLHQLDKRPVIETQVTLDGEPETFTTTHRTMYPEIPKGPASVTGVALLTMATGVLIYIPRRLNRW